MRRQIFQLRVELSDVTPVVWRRVLVPGGYTLDRLHRVFQHAMGWRDCCPHCFDIDGRRYTEPEYGAGPVARDELDVRLDAVIDKGGNFRYTYDFADWWEHEVTVEDVFSADPDERYPVCVEGRRACPPEGVGGPFGYRALLAAVADPARPEHWAAGDLVGVGFDPDRFDAGRATTLLRRFC